MLTIKKKFTKRTKTSTNCCVCVCSVCRRTSVRRWIVWCRWWCGRTRILTRTWPPLSPPASARSSSTTSTPTSSLTTLTTSMSHFVYHVCLGTIRKSCCACSAECINYPTIKVVSGQQSWQASSTKAGNTMWYITLSGCCSIWRKTIP